jgi:hypothetical protein
MSDNTNLVGSITLNSRNCIKLELTKFADHWIVNLRRWFVSGDGKLKPTRKGIAFSVEHLPELSSLVRKALKRAKRKGLVGEKEAE